MSRHAPPSPAGLFLFIEQNVATALQLPHTVITLLTYITACGNIYTDSKHKRGGTEMQTVKYTIKHLTGTGWRDWRGTITVDETIGLRAGRDEYATARGTVKRLMRKTLMHPATRATLVVGDKLIEIWLDNGRFCHKMTERYSV